jgi:hypothetical protein
VKCSFNFGSSMEAIAAASAQEGGRQWAGGRLLCASSTEE